MNFITVISYQILAWFPPVWLQNVFFFLKKKVFSFACMCMHIWGHMWCARGRMNWHHVCTSPLSTVYWCRVSLWPCWKFPGWASLASQLGLGIQVGRWAATPTSFLSGCLPSEHWSIRLHSNSSARSSSQPLTMFSEEAFLALVLIIAACPSWFSWLLRPLESGAIHAFLWHRLKRLCPMFQILVFVPWCHPHLSWLSLSQGLVGSGWCVWKGDLGLVLRLLPDGWHQETNSWSFCSRWQIVSLVTMVAGSRVWRGHVSTPHTDFSACGVTPWLCVDI